MGNSLRCCLACVLPCGALDLIRIVHLNGHVEEITRPVTAGEVLKNNPNHVLSKPCSQGVVRKILILSPESELKRGSIYFLIPESSLPEKKRTNNSQYNTSKKASKKISSSVQKTTSCDDRHNIDELPIPPAAAAACEAYLADLASSVKVATTECNTASLSEKKAHRRHRRSSTGGKSALWKPHLESIVED